MSKVRDVNGTMMPADDTHFTETLEQSRRYQGEKIDMCIIHARRRGRLGTAVDVGAHVGLWTRELAKEFGLVISFEPVPILYECLKYNTSQLPNVKPYNFAVTADGEGVQVKYVAGNSGNSHIVPGGCDEHKAFGYRLNDLTNIDFIKIDVEGYEREVLAGGERLIREWQPLILIEQKPGNAERYGWQRYGARDLLKAWGAKELWSKAGDHLLGWGSK